jgi:aspartate dehydrogenase
MGYTVAIAGLGAIGLPVAKALDAGIDGLTLVAVSARDRERAADKLAGLRRPVPVLGLAELAERADVVVESIPAASFAEVAEPAIERGRIFMPLSVGVLLFRMDLVERARETGARILVPTGALLGLDAVRAAAEGRLDSVTMVTRKPPRGLKGAPHVLEQGIDLDAIAEPTCVFRGNAFAAAKGFPANLNVGVALSLAGIGPERTEIEIWADPTVSRNTHRIKVDGDAARFELLIEGVPTEENPATGKLTPLSVIAALRGLTSPLKIGT